MPSYFICREGGKVGEGEGAFRNVNRTAVCAAINPYASPIFFDPRELKTNNAFRTKRK